MLKRAMVGTSGTIAAAFLRQRTYGANLLADGAPAPDRTIKVHF